MIPTEDIIPIVKNTIAAYGKNCAVTRRKAGYNQNRQ